MPKNTSSFTLLTHKKTASTVRELAASDPRLAEIGGADNGKVCCTRIGSQVWCERDRDA